MSIELHSRTGELLRGRACHRQVSEEGGGRRREGARGPPPKPPPRLPARKQGMYINDSQCGLLDSMFNILSFLPLPYVQSAHGH